jgi:hypothetical protein
MTDLEKAEAVVCAIGEKRAACIRAGTDLQYERASVALAAYTGDEKARKRLDEIEAALTAHASSLGSIDAAIKAAAEHVIAAQAAVARVDAATARTRARDIIETLLTGCAPKLDEIREHPDGNGPYHYADPPTVAGTAALVGSLMTELKALGLANDATTFPVRDNWMLASKDDLRRELVKTMATGWHYVASGVRRPYTPGRRQPHPLPFVKIFTEWQRLLAGALREPEQSNKTEQAA